MLNKGKGEKKKINNMDQISDATKRDETSFFFGIS
jgi:hypothetical protein